MRTCGGAEARLYALLTSALDDGNRPAFPPDRFVPWQRASCALSIGWVGLRISLDTIVSKENLPLPGIEVTSNDSTSFCIEVLGDAIK
jgi:hypothetical protein